jgi:spore coat polysaccharide biosynthesis protein SpsF
MTESFKTEQETFWAGSFGDSYIERNSDPSLISYKTVIFSKIIERTNNISHVLEFGANIGLNLLAIKNLIPKCSFGAVEINESAIKSLESISNVQIFRGSVFDFSSNDLGKYDLTFTFAVLIHINPNLLSEIYSRLYECSRSYICLIEYYNPTPVEVKYRGYSKRLFKRDFAGEMLDKYPDLKLIDYGFQYHRDYSFPLDDYTWFLLQKK